MYDGGWKDKAAEGYGVMKWQNGDRSVVSFSKLKVCRMGWGTWLVGAGLRKSRGSLSSLYLYWWPSKSRVVITSVTLITRITRYEGDWVEGLREGKGKYLSKATGENAPPASDDQNDGGSQGANTRGSMQPT